MMDDVLEGVARVGLAMWVGESQHRWDTETVLGTIGDELYLIEIDASNRERFVLDLVDNHGAGDGALRIEIVFFGDAGGVFASSLDFLELWPKSPADIPADVFVDDRYKAAFTRAGDEIIVSVRHALRPSGGPARRRFRFHPNAYEQAISDLRRESRRLRDEIIAIAQQRAPEHVEALRGAFARWPA